MNLSFYLYESIANLKLCKNIMNIHFIFDTNISNILYNFSCTMHFCALTQSDKTKFYFINDVNNIFFFLSTRCQYVITKIFLHAVASKAQHAAMCNVLSNNCLEPQRAFRIIKNYYGIRNMV